MLSQFLVSDLDNEFRTQERRRRLRSPKPHKGSLCGRVPVNLYKQKLKVLNSYLGVCCD